VRRSAVERELRDDLTDDWTELIAMTGKAASNRNAGIVRVLVDDEVAVGRERIGADSPA
jgi:hypothetical protein